MALAASSAAQLTVLAVKSDVADVIVADTPVFNTAVPSLLVRLSVAVTFVVSAAPPSVTAAVPANVTVAVSSSVTFTEAEPAELSDAALVVTSVADNDSNVASTNTSSVAVTEIVLAPAASLAAQLTVLAVKSGFEASVMPLMAVCSEAAPVPLVFKVRVAVSNPVAPPSVALAVPDRVTVALSLSLRLTVSTPEPPIV